MLKNFLTVCLTLVISVSVANADQQKDQVGQASQISVELEHAVCESPDDSPAQQAFGFESMQFDGDQLASTCCKICTKGKACGNSCIQKSKTCHKGRGCACDG